MTTNKSEVVAWMKPAPPTMNSVDSVITARERRGASRLTLAGYKIALVRLSDYEALQAELETVKKVAYGNIELLERNEALQAELARELQRRFDGNEQASREHRADVKALVEALERISNMDSMSYHSLESAKIVARKALDTHRKQQEGQP